MIYHMYVFNSKYECVYYVDWQRTVERSTEDLEGEQKLLKGLVYSLKGFSKRISPNPTEEHSGFHYFTTSQYKLHFYESPSAMKFIIFSSPTVADMRDSLKHIYRELFVPHVVQNPLWTPGGSIEMEHFTSALNKYVRGLSAYSSA